MSDEALSPSGVDRFGSRGTAVFVLVCPALLWAGQYVSESNFQQLYRHLLNILPIWAPVLALYWIAALFRLFWLERLPGPLKRDSTHMKTAVRLGQGLFWGVAIGLAGALMAGFLGFGSKSRVMNSFGLGSCICLGAGFAVQEYVKFRREPRANAVSGPHMRLMLPVLPVLLFFLGMMLVASWGEAGWMIGIGTVFVVVLLLFFSMLREERTRRREERELREGNCLPQV